MYIYIYLYNICKCILNIQKLVKENKIDILVNAAGISRDGLLLKMKDDDLNETMAINLFGTMRVSQIVSRSMLQKRQGKKEIEKSGI